MPDEGPLEHYLSSPHESAPDIPEPTAEGGQGPWRERGILLGLGFLVGCIGAYALIYAETSDQQDALENMLTAERESNIILQHERDRLLSALEQSRVDSLLVERSPLALSAPGQTSKSPVIPPAPPMTPAVPQGSGTDRLANPGEQDWKERYQYAALKYNKVVKDYNKLRQLYTEMVGKGAPMTGVQLYWALRQDTRTEIRKLDEQYMQGLKSWQLKEVERGREEMRHRDWWLKKMGNKFKLD